jgi:3-deoxy-D-manno-octulosonic acid (KDO) 8-phosphate synthase
VTPLSLAALAAGACGLIVEVHPDPDKAMSDGAQSLDFEMFEDLCGKMGKKGKTGKSGRTAEAGRTEWPERAVTLAVNGTKGQ